MRLLIPFAAFLLLAPSPSAQAPDIVLYPSDVTVISGNWARVSSTTGAGGQKMFSVDHGWATPDTPLAAPADYFEASFQAEPGTPYRLWLRLRGKSDSRYNESVWVQFSGAVTGSGAPLWPIGSTSALLVNLEDCNGCGIADWGWQDNAWWLGTSSVVRFSASGAQTIRVQTREDGVDVDQIVLSPATYFSSPPGSVKNDSTIVPKGGGSSPSSSVLRGPYLQQVTDRAAIVVWTTWEPGPGDVRYTAPGGMTVTIPGTSRFFTASATGMPHDFYQHEARLGGLAAATRYPYEILMAGSATGVTGSLTTAPSTGGGRTRFIAFGDSGTGSVEQRQLADRMTADRFDVSLHSGDVAYGNTGGTGAPTHRLYDQWVFDIYRGWMRDRAFSPAMGNHDVEPDDGRPYLDVFVLPENGASGAYPDHAERFYSFDYGPVHFVALDTEVAFQDTARRQAQLDWLDADLRSTSQPWKVAYFHRPPYSASRRSDLAVRAAFAPLFEKHGVQLVLSAHDHNYERSTPWREHVTGGAAVTYVVTGGGGGPLYRTGLGAWTATNALLHHYVRADVFECTLTLEAVGLDGAAFDRFVLDRCAQAADAAAPAAQILQPSHGAAISGPTPVSVQATDDTTVVKVDLLVDGVLHAVDATSPFGWTLDASALPHGTHVLQARAHDLAGRSTTSAPVSVTVGGPGSTPRPVPGTIQAEDFDEGPNGTAYFDTTAGNSGGQYRSTDVDIEGTSDAGGGYNVGWIATGEWLSYTVDVQAAGTYQLDLRVASPGGASMRVLFDGIDRSGALSIPATGSWQNWATVSRTVTLNAGPQVMRLAFDSGGHNINWVCLSAAGGGSQPYGGTPRAIPGTVQSEDFDEGGANVAYFDRTAGNNGGQYRATDVDIERTGDVSGTYNIGWASAGEWLNYTIDVTAAGSYTLTTRVASPATGGTFHVEFNGVDKTGPIQVPNTGGWQVYRDLSVPVTLEAGIQVMRVVLDTNASTNAVGNFNYIRIQ